MASQPVDPPQRRGRTRAEPAVRLARPGEQFMFNAAAKQLLEGVTHLRLIFDAATRQISFQPTDEVDPRGHRVYRIPSAANISAKTFVNFQGLAGGQLFPFLRDGSLFVAPAAARLR